MSIIGDITIVDPREAKLPAWARAKLDDARRQVRDAQYMAEQAIQETDPDNSLAIIDRYSYRVGLKDDHVTFKPSKDAGYHDCIDVHAISGGIQIHGRRGPIHILPIASNVVRIKNVDDW